jgi:hypothetical protein
VSGRRKRRRRLSKKKKAKKEAAESVLRCRRDFLMRRCTSQWNEESREEKGC